MELPRDCWRGVFGFISSYYRAKACMVSREWRAITVGMIGTYATGRDATIAGDYHAIVRAKDYGAIDVSAAYESGDDDVIAYVLAWDPGNNTGSMIGAIRGNHLHLVKKLCRDPIQIPSTIRKWYKIARVLGCYEIVEYFLKTYNFKTHTLEYLSNKSLRAIEKRYIPCSSCAEAYCVKCLVLHLDDLGCDNNWDVIKLLGEVDPIIIHYACAAAVRGAYFSGHVALVDAILAIDSTCDNYMHPRRLFGNITLLENYLKRYGASQLILEYACLSGKLDAVNIVCDELICTHDEYEIKAVYSAACKGGNIAIVRRIARYLPKLCDLNAEGYVKFYDGVNCYGLYDACDILMAAGFMPVDNTGSYVVKEYVKCHTTLL